MGRIKQPSQLSPSCIQKMMENNFLQSRQEHPQRQKRPRASATHIFQRSNQARMLRVLPWVAFVQCLIFKNDSHASHFIGVAQAAKDAYTHFPTPTLKWQVHLGGEDGGGDAGFMPHISGSSFRRGNGIVPSPDGKRLYATLDDGHLTVLNPSNGQILFSYLPQPRGEGYDISCASSAIISPQKVKTQNDKGKEHVSEAFVVYAVMDTPPAEKWDTSEFWYDTEEWYQTGKYSDFAAPAASMSGQPADPDSVLKIGRIAGLDITAASSRVIAVDVHTGKEKWTYELAKSTIVGTPIFSTDGKFVYVVANDSVTGGGRFVILHLAEDNKGKIRVEKFHESGWDSSTFYPYSPMTKTRATTMSGTFDALFWIETMSDRAGYSSTGRIHRVLVNLRTKLVKTSYIDDVMVGSAVAPWVSDDGRILHISGRGGKVIRKVWELNEDAEGVRTEWEASLDLSRRNGTMPLLNRVASSRDESVVFVPSSATSFSCLDTATGAEVWKTDFNASVYLTEPKVSKDDMIVYSILQNDGTVIAQFSTTGWPLWKMNCVNTTGQALCQDSVEAEFTLSADGADLIYGDVYGTLTALTVADAPPLPDPTPSPTFAPTASPVVTPSPTSKPTPAPTTAHPSHGPTSNPSKSPSTAPSKAPTMQPTMQPTKKPSMSPSESPSRLDSEAPSTSPGVSPSQAPSNAPSTAPSVRSTTIPTNMPTNTTTDTTTLSPTLSPTKLPTLQPTVSPSGAPQTSTSSPHARKARRKISPEPSQSEGGNGIFGNSSSYLSNLSNKGRAAVGLGFASIGVLLVSLSYLGMGAIQRLRNGHVLLDSGLSVRATV